MNGTREANGANVDGVRGTGAGDVGGQRLRRVAANFATGVAVVTSVADDVPVGTTVNAFATVSLDPAMVLVCLRYGSRLLSAIEDAGVFAATVLSADQRRAATWFASRTRPTGAAAFAGIPARPAPGTGCLLLTEGLAYFDCRVAGVFPGGDHAVVLGQVVECRELLPREPLVFAGSGFVRVESFATHVAAGGVAVPAGVASRPESGATVSGSSGRSTSATASAVTTRR